MIKELIKQVLNIKEELTSFSIENNTIKLILRREDDYFEIYQDIDINTLAFKCKEWAFNLDKQLIIKSYTVRNAGVCEVKDKMGIHLETLDAKNEADAIIKTCEWILTKDSK